MEDIEKGEINFISVSSIDRLGRNLFDVLKSLNYFNENGVILRVNNLGLESRVNEKPNPVFKLIISVLANISEMERTTMLERQKEGIRIAINKGKYLGRVKGSSESNEQFLAKYPGVVKEIKAGKISMRKIAKLNDVSLGTVQKVKSKLDIES